MKRIRIILLIICLLCLFSTTSCGNAQLVGQWYGQVESQDDSNKGEKLDVHLSIYDEGTWVQIFNGEIRHGTWSLSADNKNVLNLETVFFDDKYNHGWTFGKSGLSYKFDYNYYDHYTAGMKRVDVGATSQDDLVGKWHGQVESKHNTNKGNIIDVYLSINSDGTWDYEFGGYKRNGNWRSYTNSGGILSLLVEYTGEGIENDNLYWYFGRLNGKYVYGFNHYEHYEVIMEKTN